MSKQTEANRQAFFQGLAHYTAGALMLARGKAEPELLEQLGDQYARAMLAATAHHVVHAKEPMTFALVGAMSEIKNQDPEGKTPSTSSVFEKTLEQFEQRLSLRGGSVHVDMGQLNDLKTLDEYSRTLSGCDIRIKYYAFTNEDIVAPSLTALFQFKLRSHRLLKNDRYPNGLEMTLKHLVEASLCDVSLSGNKEDVERAYAEIHKWRTEVVARWSGEWNKEPEGRYYVGSLSGVWD